MQYSRFYELEYAPTGVPINEELYRHKEGEERIPTIHVDTMLINIPLFTQPHNIFKIKETPLIDDQCMPLHPIANAELRGINGLNAYRVNPGKQEKKDKIIVYWDPTHITKNMSLIRRIQSHLTAVDENNVNVFSDKLRNCIDPATSALLIEFNDGLKALLKTFRTIKQIQAYRLKQDRKTPSEEIIKQMNENNHKNSIILKYRLYQLINNLLDKVKDAPVVLQSFSRWIRLIISRNKIGNKEVQYTIDNILKHAGVDVMNVPVDKDIIEHMSMEDWNKLITAAKPGRNKKMMDVESLMTNMDMKIMELDPDSIVQNPTWDDLPSVDILEMKEMFIMGVEELNPALINLTIEHPTITLPILVLQLNSIVTKYTKSKDVVQIVKMILTKIYELLRSEFAEDVDEDDERVQNYINDRMTVILLDCIDIAMASAGNIKIIKMLYKICPSFPSEKRKQDILQYIESEEGGYAEKVARVGATREQINM